MGKSFGIIKNRIRDFKTSVIKNERMILAVVIIAFLCIASADLLVHKAKSGSYEVREAENTVTRAMPLNPEEAAYVHSSSSKVIHRVGCAIAERINEENRVYLTEADAEHLEGFRCCKSCLEGIEIEELPGYSEESGEEGAVIDRAFVQPPEEEAAYVRSKSSDVIHKVGCSAAERIHEENRIYYSEEPDGFKHCSICW